MAEQRDDVLTLPDPSAVDGIAYGFVDGVKTSVYHFTPGQSASGLE